MTWVFSYVHHALEPNSKQQLLSSDTRIILNAILLLNCEF